MLHKTGRALNTDAFIFNVNGKIAAPFLIGKCFFIDLCSTY